MTPLHISVEKENIEIVQLLLENPKLDVNILCKKTYNAADYIETALHIAIEKENLEIIKLLLDNEKIQINQTCKIETSESSSWNYKCEEKTALHCAVQKGNIEIIKLLLKNKDIDINFPFFIYFKSTEEDFDSNDKHESKREKTALHLAIEKQNIEIVKLLVSNEKININASVKFTSSCNCKRADWKYKCNIENESPALYVAVDEGNIEIVSLLLQNDNIDVNLPFKHKMNIENEKDTKFKELTPLHIAVKNKKVEIVSLLLKNKRIDVNIPIESSDQSESKKTALHLAVKTGTIDIIKMLLQNKDINTNVCDFFSKNPISYTNDDKIKQLFNS